MVNEHNMPPPSPRRLSWGFLVVIGLAIWLLFFEGWGSIASLLTPSTSTIVYQTATAGPNQPVLPVRPIQPNTGSRPAVQPAPEVLTVPTTGVIYHTDPVVVPTMQALPGVAQNEATSAAMYQATVAAVDVPAQPAPVNVTVPSDRVLPTIEPINIQATHTCLHGQVWTDSGCRNPDGVGAERHKP